MGKELKPCPFCGGAAEFVDGKWVNCGNMHCTANDYGLLPAHWNTRPIEDALREELAASEEADEHKELAVIADQTDCAIATDKVKVTIEERDEWKRKAEAYRKLIGENSKAVQYNKDIAYDLGERLKDMQELNVQITADRDRLREALIEIACPSQSENLL